MKLLVFAHRAEAQTFLRQAQYKSIDLHGLSLYQNEDSYLLITKEGIFNALEGATTVLASLDNIDSVINLGVAGGLDSRVEKGAIYQIRTAYSIINDKLEFKSYSSNSTSTIDCITSSSRTLTKEEADKLSCFAHIVDRELWAVAKAASNFSVEFKALKLISDLPYAEENEAGICEIVKEKAEVYSDQLYKEFLKIEYKENEKANFIINNYKELYFTVSQYRNYTTLISQLLTKFETEEEILREINIDSLLNIEALPKQRSALLLEKLRELLTPFNTKLNNQIEAILHPLKQSGLKITLSKNLESDQFKISATIDNEVELQKISKSLKNFNYKDYQLIMRGKIDV
ncbi:hypothetical protein BMS_1038 [Halobacteriovorax marinus SJ]|uniref:Nucleoside phosphorylase domain-containing protein n=1 Tax=Halobacteriovorax marinus (strain ATCC BAA-682 / DSM 15412 / SJ) TaxID=862908 RepID=E1WXW5_HALMS|nr:hypothetical protein [Halobacteriovorax marinus]CBW25922.1 hypothetical protein BMS_1038 [Halobacteriovorax marinus SJ]